MSSPITIIHTGHAANRLKPGSDGGLHVADTLSDPVAYYILAKS